MNTLTRLFYLIIASLAVVSCTRDFDAPPIAKPEYKGEANITIAQLKQRYAGTTSATPTLIDVDFVLKAYITGNDKSGNIFKQLYIQDETGAINIGVDQSNMYTYYGIGQEVFINLHGFSMVSYGGELQIGYAGTIANRIPWETFREQIFLNGWPDTGRITPKTVTIADLTPDMVNMLIRLDKVYFTNGGKNNFTTGNATTNEPLKDGNGNTLDVRTSSYANFAVDQLPEGSGTVVGLLGRYNGGWQLIVRSMDDIINFGGEIPGPDDPAPVEGVVFNETFGNGSHLTQETRPKIADFTGFDMKAPVAYADETGNADIRSTSAINPHVWFPSGKDNKLAITGINTSGKTNLVLTYEVAANLFDAGASGNLNILTVTCDGVALNVPDMPVSNANGDNNKYYTFTFENIPAKENLTIEFAASGTANTFGLRLDNIKIATSDTHILNPGG